MIVIILPLSLLSSKSTFSQPLKRKCISEMVRIGSIIIFHLSKLWKAKFFVLCDVKARSNERNMLHATSSNMLHRLNTLLHDVAWSLNQIKLHATSSNIVQQGVQTMQHVARNNVGRCCMQHVAFVWMGLNTSGEAAGEIWHCTLRSEREHFVSNLIYVGVILQQKTDVRLKEMLEVRQMMSGGKQLH